MAELDNFTKAYITAAFWSSTENPFGTCPQCGKEDQILCRWGEWVTGKGNPHVCTDCSDKEPDHEPPMDENYSITDLAPEALAKIVDDCAKFQAAHGELFTNENCKYHGCPPDEYAGHDFWLTRNGHGCGFWDGNWEEPAATTLDNASKAFGECDLYVGDDGKVYS